MKLYIVRHGETDENIQGIIQGWLDTELNKNGLSQARIAAESFTANIDAIYSSDLKRAKRTALEFRGHHKDIPYFEDKRLRERNFGDAAGTHKSQYDWEQFWSFDDKSIISGAEILKDFTARIKDFLTDLEAEPYGSVLIVTHGGVQNRIQTILDPNHKYYPHPNASIIEIDT